MIHEYPKYVEVFKCIGGECPDSCCIGWEVDIDEETYYYYRTVQGDFGKRLEASICEEDGERFFPLVEKKRCPFLNDRNLCDIYTNLGEEHLCTVCTEYPRYYEVVGDYEQIDMSLSCMEYGRIYFGDTESVKYIKKDDGFGGDGLSKRLSRRLERVTELRDDTIRFIENYDVEDGSLKEFFREVSDFMKNKAHSLRLNCYKSIAAYGWVYGTDRDEKDVVSELNRQMASLEILDERWNAVLSDTEESLKSWAESEQFFAESFSRSSYYLFKKLMTYFVFRYTIEAYFDKNANFDIGLIEKSVLYIYVMFVNEYRKKSSGTNGISADEDRLLMIDLAHIYSREVEHSDDNLIILKGIEA